MNARPSIVLTAFLLFACALFIPGGLAAESLWDRLDPVGPGAKSPPEAGPGAAPATPPPPHPRVDPLDTPALAPPARFELVAAAGYAWLRDGWVPRSGPLLEAGLRVPVEGGIIQSLALTLTRIDVGVPATIGGSGWLGETALLAESPALPLGAAGPDLTFGAGASLGRLSFDGRTRDGYGLRGGVRLAWPLGPAAALEAGYHADWRTIRVFDRRAGLSHRLTAGLAVRF
ncbi:MAG: hypothetical protein EA425_01455 [Puniceicoccaceae bacterium]|nr:MAG: hypothetical protein EA425_01455 [Puniceicoccaceae bacterium]